MTDLLVKLFVKDYEQTDNLQVDVYKRQDSYRGKKGDDSRTQYGSRTSLVDAAG